MRYVVRHRVRGSGIPLSTSKRHSATWSLKLETTGTITNFTSAVNNLFNIGGDAYRVETAGKSYSLTNPDPQTLRFEIRPGDYTWFDSAGTVDRANIDGSAQYIQPGTPVSIGYQ